MAQLVHRFRWLATACEAAASISPTCPTTCAAAPWRSAISTACTWGMPGSSSGCSSRPAKLGGPAVVFTFDPHPVRLLRPAEAPPPLTWTDRKAELLAELGVDAMIAYPTDEELLQLSAAGFFDQIVREQLAARAMVEGPNFFFGRDRSGTIDVLRRLDRRGRDRARRRRAAGGRRRVCFQFAVRRLIADGRVDEARHC